MMEHPWMKKVVCKFMSVKKPRTLSVKKAVTALKKLDHELMPLFEAFNPDDITPETDYFRSLTRAIIHQQLSGVAAKTISDRFIALYDGKSYPSPEDIIQTEHDILRSVGLSNAKAQYIKNISNAFLNGTVDFENIHNLSDDDIVKQLVSIKGVGPWTAKMFLMFTLARPDVFPIGDLGVQKGVQQFFKLDTLPTPKDMEQRSQIWRPHRTVMSLFFWNVVDGPFDW